MTDSFCTLSDKIREFLLISPFAFVHDDIGGFQELISGKLVVAAGNLYDAVAETALVGAEGTRLE